MALSISVRVACGCVSSHDFACITMPGVQNPHWTAPHSTNARSIACPSASRARPSIVVTARPSQSTANIRHAQRDVPSTITVHAPHSPSPHAYLVPVSPNASRSITSALMSTGTVAWVFARNDVAVLEAGELEYGLAYPDGAGRLLDDASTPAR